MEKYMVKAKELNSHKLSELVRRSYYPLLNRFGLSLILGYENNPSQPFRHNKALTSLYRCSTSQLIPGQNRILQDAVFKALAEDYDDPSDRTLAQHIWRYMEEKAFSRCPIALDMDAIGEAHADR